MDDNVVKMVTMPPAMDTLLAMDAEVAVTFPLATASPKMAPPVMHSVPPTANRTNHVTTRYAGTCG